MQAVDHTCTCLRTVVKNNSTKCGLINVNLQSTLEWGRQQSSIHYLKYRPLLETTLRRSAVGVYDAISKICGIQLEELLQRTEQLFISCCWLCFQWAPVRSACQGWMGWPKAHAEQWKITTSLKTSCLRSSGVCEASSQSLSAEKYCWHWGLGYSFIYLLLYLLKKCL